MNTHYTVRQPYGMLLSLGLAALVICVSSGSGIVVADSAATVEPCSSGVAVNNPGDNPLLVQDCDALLAARDTLSRGGRRLIWTADTSMSKWDGVSIGGSPARVRELQLSADGSGKGSLKGDIPLELGRLTGLVTLDLSRNSLGGNIPAELGRLTRLVTLDLGGNSLSGEIPAELGLLANLHTLDLNTNELVGEIPAELGLLTNLWQVRLFNNQLTGEMPPELGGLTNLRRLSLSSNQLSGEIPLELGGLADLQNLGLSGNKLTGEIPEELGDLTNLTWLQLRGNRLTGRIPRELGKLIDLQVLDLAYNELTGNIPTELGELNDLESLDLSNNELTGGVPPELGKMTTLEVLQLSNNTLSGQIPVALGQLTELRLLWLDGNKLTGEIPEWISELSRLEYLDLRSNELTGEIPSTIGELTNVEYLRLAGNQFSGKIPVELGGLSNLLSLDLDGNRLSGEIPAELGNLAKLSGLALSDNRLIGRIPPVLGGLANLRSLYLSRNRLTGEIPAALGQLANLDYLELSQNRLTGEIPSVLADLTNLIGLWVQTNDLTGCVPLALSRFDKAVFDNTSLRFCFALDDDPTVSSSSSLTVGEEGTLTIHESVLLANDMETENYTLRITEVSDAVNGAVSVEGPTITYEHDGSETTTGSFSYIASDGVYTSTAMVTVTVTPVNDPPVAASDNATVDEGGALSIEAPVLLDNDTDAENDPLEVLAVGDAVNGIVSLEGPTITYEHDGSETTTGGFSYTVGDGTDTATAVVTVTVTPVNDPPVAAGDNATVDEGGALSIEAPVLLDNDTDAENDPLEVLAVGDAVNGIVSLEGPTITYEHDGSETTTGGFSYIASDGVYTSTAMVTVTVTPVNDPPVAAGDNATVDEGGALSIEAPVLLDNDTDAENDPLEILAVGDVVNGIVSLGGPAITYEHDGSETATGGFTYTVGDGTDTATAVVTVTVTPVNDPPVAAGDNATVDEGGALSIEAPVLLDNDTDAENDPLEVLAVGDAVNGIVSLEGPTITYEHDGSETTTGGFSYTVGDGTDTATAVVTVTVTPVNDPPVAASDNATVDEGGALSIEAPVLLDNDTDAENDPLEILAVGDAVNGIVSLEGPTITYEHDGSETTTGSFSYTVGDGTDTATAVVTVTVTPVNDPPVASGDNATVDEGGALSIEAPVLLDNDTDAENDPLEILAVGDAVNGIVSLEGPTITYEHDGSETTTGGFSYIASDGVYTSTAMVTVTVTPVNDPPVAAGDNATVDEGGALSIEAPVLLDNDTDAENDPLEVLAVGDAVNGIVSLEGPAITYEHDGSETTTGSFSYISR